jgi:hypothetical protein
MGREPSGSALHALSQHRTYRSDTAVWRVKCDEGINEGDRANLSASPRIRRANRKVVKIIAESACGGGVAGQNR